MMLSIHPRLFELVQKLDELGGEPTLAGIARAMEEANLTAEDVAEFVHEDPKSHQRKRVVLRDHYELLVMTWLPGQSSFPNDHIGSVCAVRVIEGIATESCYRAASDGFVDLEYETRVGQGEVSAGQDAGIHSLINREETGKRLITVHVYAPPLKDLRRFIPRPKPRTQVTVPFSPPTVVVVGGGFSGSMTAAQILKGARKSGSRLRVVLLERGGSIGEGVAYSTRELEHLLNVPAARMSAWPDRPDDFLNWARERNRDIRPSDFLPRQWYGDYVRQTLHDNAREAAPSGELVVQLDEARRVARHPQGGWMVHMERGTSVRADAVVLAIGHRPPSDPLTGIWKGSRECFFGDPWRPFALNAITPVDSVFVLGTGLTAIDSVLSLTRQPRTGPITLVSRRGLLPLAHKNEPVPPVEMTEWVRTVTSLPGGLKAGVLCKQLRKVAREKMAAGIDWRGVVDGLRPHLPTLWEALSVREKRRFLVHLRPFWEIHRHRMAFQIGEKCTGLLESGTMRIIKGRVVSVEAGPKVSRLAIRETGSRRVTEAQAQWIINCTGPLPSNKAESNPVIGSLLVTGWVKPDELSLGLETSPMGGAIDARGNEVPDLFVVGTLRKPALWESTAVPELRQQAAQVGEAILKRLEAPAASTVGQAI